jgi:hypothetical protein
MAKKTTKPINIDKIKLKQRLTDLLEVLKVRPQTPAILARIADVQKRMAELM